MEIFKKPAYLFGPFVGDLYWETYRFAPHALYLKKENPQTKLIVFTRQERFDLYGAYADILVPLKLSKVDEDIQIGFTSKYVDDAYYQILGQYIHKKYSNNYNIINHLYPNISAFFYKVKWQFPKDKMIFNFQPRRKNKLIVHKYLGNLQDIILTDCEDDYSDILKGYNIININDFKTTIINDPECSFIGCMIELIKRSSLILSDINSYLSKLSLLLRTRVILTNDKVDHDYISLINPFKVKYFLINK